jgi:hypothetical protein
MANCDYLPDTASLCETMRALAGEFHSGAVAETQDARATLAEAELQFGFAFRNSHGNEFDISLAASLLAYRQRFSQERERLQKISFLVKPVPAGESPNGAAPEEPTAGTLAALIGALRSGLGQAAVLASGKVRLTEAEIETGAEISLARSGERRLRVRASPVSAAWTRQTAFSRSAASKLRARFTFNSGKDGLHGGD